MFKLAKYIYKLGRRQAYTEVVAKLETTAVNLPRTREGQLLRQPINELIDSLVKQLEEGRDESI